MKLFYTFTSTACSLGTISMAALLISRCVHTATRSTAATTQNACSHGAPDDQVRYGQTLTIIRDLNVRSRKNTTETILTTGETATLSTELKHPEIRKVTAGDTLTVIRNVLTSNDAYTLLESKTGKEYRLRCRVTDKTEAFGALTYCTTKHLAVAPNLRLNPECEEYQVTPTTFEKSPDGHDTPVEI